jgi:basic membrane protein A and related proteins
MVRLVAVRPSTLVNLAGLAALLVACTPPPAAPAPTAPPAAQPTSAAPAAPTAAAPTAVAKPIVTQPATTPQPAAGGAAPASCKVAQVYTSPTSDKGWSWAHEQAFFQVKKDLPYVDLSIRKDSVPDDNQQAVEDLLESMVQQGAQVVYTTSFGFMEPTRAVAKRHPDMAFFHASGFPDPSDPPNIGYYFATIEEGRYITGEVAGLAVDPGANIGYVAAHPIPEVFRGENAFALGVMKTNPGAKVYNKWTLTWFDPQLEKNAAESLLEPPIKADLLSQHQDSTATQLAAQDAGKLGIAYDADMNDNAPRATLTSPVWNWAVHNTPTAQAACTGAWSQGGKVTIPEQYKNWMGSMRDGTVSVAPLNMTPLGNHPRKEQIQKLYNDDVAAFRSGQKNFESLWTQDEVRDQTGQVRVQKGGPLDVAALYDERGQWFVENVVGSPLP